MGVWDRILRRLRGAEPAGEPAPGLFTAHSLPTTSDAGTSGTDEPLPAPEDLWDRPPPPPEAPPEPGTGPAPAPEPARDAVPAEDDHGAGDRDLEQAALAALAALDPDPDAPVEQVDHVEPEPPVAPEPADAPPPPEPPPAEDIPPTGGSVADEPLFGRHGAIPEPPPGPDPVPPLFDRPAVVNEPEPADLIDAPTPSPEPAPTPTPEPTPEPGRPPAPRDEDGRTVRVHDGRLDRRPGPIKMTPSEAMRLAQDGPRALRHRPDPDA